MIVSVFNTKGGSGKTSTSTLLLSAIAKSNAEGNRAIKTIAMDTDPQGTLSAFFYRRAKSDRPDLAITHQIMNLQGKAPGFSSEEAQVHLRNCAEICDMLILDCAGSFDTSAAAAILVSDIVVVPAAMVTAEISVAIPIIRGINRTAEVHGLDVTACLAINREEPIPSKTQKALGQIVEEEDIPVLSTRIPRLGVIAEMISHGLYLHEMQGQGSSEKSLTRSLGKGAGLLGEISEHFNHNQQVA